MTRSFWLQADAWADDSWGSFIHNHACALQNQLAICIRNRIHSLAGTEITLPSGSFLRFLTGIRPAACLLRIFRHTEFIIM